MLSQLALSSPITPSQRKEAASTCSACAAHISNRAKMKLHIAEHFIDDFPVLERSGFAVSSRFHSRFICQICFRFVSSSSLCFSSQLNNTEVIKSFFSQFVSKVSDSLGRGKKA
jgi:hypothetical protein